MELSVLDQSTASKGLPEDQAIRETLALARLCDTLGYRRYWVSEHHNSRSIVGTAPEILMAAIAATTSTTTLSVTGAVAFVAARILFGFGRLTRRRWLRDRRRDWSW